ncbi:MAG: 16S rRNA (uracil(1498)-N(3))-methyltransferase [Peptococcaceae bacterium]|jgi:16S rRNA (uracil1498-N3)-methyltransferase|nr:16S rRNA (uracil(1498)-N(3))-methyltransferase [Peptococcaceae bacterium]
MERFYVDPDALTTHEARITGDEYKHLKNVLRMKIGDAVEVFDGKGRGFSGRLKLLDKAEALAELDEAVTEVRDSALHICLAQGIPKGEKMDLIIQKNTELGVDTIIPLELSRCVVRLDGDKKRKDRQTRWQRVAKEAARQCGRLTVPEVSLPMEVEEFLQQVSNRDLLLIPWEEGGQPLKAFFAVAEVEKAAGMLRRDRIFVMIGPEGGMTADEVEAGKQAGGWVLTLGPRLLRTETAGMALLSILQYQWGDAG